MKILTLDVESTIFQYPGNRKPSDKRGHPLSTYNKLMSIVVKWMDKSPEFIYKPEEKYYNLYLETQLNTADIVVGFNIKYDLHWLNRLGVDVLSIKQVWDCQLAEFMLESQRNPYPSLNQACEKYGLPLKLDEIKTEYWDKGIDTDEIPMPTLQEYNEYDVICTENVFKHQYKQFTGIDL